MALLVLEYTATVPTVEPVGLPLRSGGCFSFPSFPSDSSMGQTDWGLRTTCNFYHSWLLTSQLGTAVLGSMLKLLAFGLLEVTFTYWG